MALNDVLSRLDIDTDFSATDANLIRNSIRFVYNGSAAGRAMLDKVVDQDRTLKFTFKPNAFEALRSSFEVRIDFDHVRTRGYINENGRAVAFTPVDAIIHELVHAIDGLIDPEFKGYGTTAFDYAGFRDYTGDTVRKTNLIMDQLGFANNRVSYSGTGLLGRDLLGAFAYTDGKPIDLAINRYRGTYDTEANGRTTRDLFIGSAAADTMRSGRANDFLYGQAGNDTILAGSGADKVRGGTNDDRIDGGTEDDTLAGGSGADTLIGGGGADSLDGGSEDDTIVGHGGADTLNGGNGADKMGGGADLGKLDGGGGNDTLVGGPATDTLNGGEGNDKADGKAGNDRIDGGTDNDTLLGSGGIDTPGA
jgi:Ca2+-binding RTX toxin-like protein